MRKAVLLGGLCLMLGSLSGCGGKDTYESLTQESFEWMNEYVGVMDKVTDDTSAKKAKARLEDLARHAEDLDKRWKALGKPSEEEQKKLHDKYEKELAALLPKLRRASQTKAQYAVLRDVKVEDNVGGMDTK